MAETLHLVRAVGGTAVANAIALEHLATAFNLETAAALRSPNGESAATQATRARNYFNTHEAIRLRAFAQKLAELDDWKASNSLNRSNSEEVAPRLVRLCDGRDGLRAGLSVRISAASDSGTTSGSVLDFISSDETLDRYGEIISASGWQLDNYRRNPVFQNSHQYGDVLFTLGKALVTEVRTIEGRSVLFQRIEFATGVNPLARLAFGLYQGGFLNAVSVGFVPLRWENGTEDTPFTRRYLAQELLEVSAVSIPANPNALALGLEAGAIARDDVKELLGRVEDLTEAFAGSHHCRPGAPTGLRSPGEAKEISSIRAESRSDTRAMGSGNNEAQLLQLARHLRQILS